MCEKFQKAGLNRVTSSEGFSVEVRLAGGVLYRDANGEMHIDSEWLVNPPRILLYRRGLDKIEQSRLDSMFSDVTRAL